MLLCDKAKLKKTKKYNVQIYFLNTNSRKKGKLTTILAVAASIVTDGKTRGSS